MKGERSQRCLVPCVGHCGLWRARESCLGCQQSVRFGEPAKFSSPEPRSTEWGKPRLLGVAGVLGGHSKEHNQTECPEPGDALCQGSSEGGAIDSSLMCREGPPQDRAQGATCVCPETYTKQKVPSPPPLLHRGYQRGLGTVKAHLQGTCHPQGSGRGQAPGTFINPHDKRHSSLSQRQKPAQTGWEGC